MNRVAFEVEDVENQDPQRVEERQVFWEIHELCSIRSVQAQENTKGGKKKFRTFDFQENSCFPVHATEHLKIKFVDILSLR